MSSPRPSTPLTSHELAHRLLDLPDAEVATGLIITGYISSIDDVKTGTYPAPSWDDDAGTHREVVVLIQAEESLNEDEELNLRD